MKMKSEIKTGLVFGIVIILGIGILSVVFSTLDQEVQTTDISSDKNDITKIDKSGFKQAPEQAW